MIESLPQAGPLASVPVHDLARGKVHLVSHCHDGTGELRVPEPLGVGSSRHRANVPVPSDSDPLLGPRPLRNPPVRSVPQGTSRRDAGSGRDARVPSPTSTGDRRVRRKQAVGSVLAGRRHPRWLIIRVRAPPRGHPCTRADHLAQLWVPGGLLQVSDVVPQVSVGSSTSSPAARRTRALWRPVSPGSGTAVGAVHARLSGRGRQPPSGEQHPTARTTPVNEPNRAADELAAHHSTPPPPHRDDPMATPPSPQPDAKFGAAPVVAPIAGAAAAMLAGAPWAAALACVAVLALLAISLTWLSSGRPTAPPPPAPGSGGRTVTCDHLRSVPQEHEGRTMHGGTAHNDETDGPAAGVSICSVEQVPWQS
jgi:hypothetical protein